MSKKTDKKVLKACMCYVLIGVAPFLRVVYGLFHVADIILGVGILLHVVLAFSGIFKVTKLLLLSMPSIALLAFLGLPMRVEVMAYFICMAACWIYSTVITIKREKLALVGKPFAVVDVFSPPLFSSIFFFLKMIDMSQIADTDLDNVFLLCLIISVAVSLAITVGRAIYKHKKAEPMSKFWGHVGCFLLSLLIIFGLQLFTAQTINYAFDFSEGEQYEYTVVDKDIRNSRRGTHYELHIIGDSETKEIEVTAQRYRNTYIGDSLTMYKYKGLLGMEYYEYE